MGNSAEITGLLAYLRKDEEVQINLIAHAIAKAFNGSGKQQRRQTQHIDEDEEEVIDTTSPEFAKHFKGFINAPQQQKRMPERQIVGGTQILMG